MKTYLVRIDLPMYVDMQVEADSPSEAEAKAMELYRDDYGSYDERPYDNAAKVVESMTCEIEPRKAVDQNVR